MALAKRQAISLFLMCAAGIGAVVFIMARTPAAASRPAMMGAAGLIDLVLTIPLVYWFLVVRPGHSSWAALAVISVLGARASAWLLPLSGQRYLPPVAWLGIPLELWLVAQIVRRIRGLDRKGDALARIRAAARGIIPYERLSRIVAAEIAVLYYALFSWRAQPDTRRDWRAFPCANASGWRDFATLVALAAVCEAVPVHLLVYRWSHVAAWICTGLDLYGLLWLAALVRAARLRPILVDGERVLLRVGLVWEIEIPRERIAACRRVTGQGPKRREAGYLRTVVMTEPQWIIELTEPAVAVGLYGQCRKVTRIGIAVDEPGAFGAALCAQEGA
jgi:hypothetical protein